MADKTLVKKDYDYSSVQLDVDRFSQEYEFEILTYSDGTSEVAVFNRVIWEGDCEDVPSVHDLVYRVHFADEYDFADDYEWREDR